MSPKLICTDRHLNSHLYTVSGKQIVCSTAHDVRYSIFSKYSLPLHYSQVELLRMEVEEMKFVTRQQNS